MVKRELDPDFSRVMKGEMCISNVGISKGLKFEFFLQVLINMTRVKSG